MTRTEGLVQKAAANRFTDLLTIYSDIIAFIYGCINLYIVKSTTALLFSFGIAVH
jgi:hypothetical protein